MEKIDNLDFSGISTTVQMEGNFHEGKFYYKGTIEPVEIKESSYITLPVM